MTAVQQPRRFRPSMGPGGTSATFRLTRIFRLTLQSLEVAEEVPGGGLVPLERQVRW